MKFLFLGLGSIGQRHLKNLHALGHRDFLAWRTKLEADPFETELGVKRVSSYEAGLLVRPDVVFITNPTIFHVRDATLALESGSHVFVEKPLGASLEGVDHLMCLADEKGKTVFVGYNLRFHPILERIRALLREGTIGDPISAHITVGQHLADWHPGEDFKTSYAAREDLGGGVILTLSHELDYAQWLLGPVRTVYAAGGTSRVLGIDAEESADITLEFQSGCTATVHLDYLERPPSRSCKIIASTGKVEWDYFSDRACVTRLDSSDRQEEIRLPPGFERNDMYVAEVEHFLRVIGNKEKSRIPLASARETLMIALAARESLHSGHPVNIEGNK